MEHDTTQSSNWGDELDRLNGEIEAELKKWQEVLGPGADPNAVTNQNAFVMDTNISAIMKILVNKGIIEEDEMLVAVLQHRLDTIQKIFPEIVRMHKEQKMAVARKGIIIPPGRMDIPRGNGH